MDEKTRIYTYVEAIYSAATAWAPFMVEDRRQSKLKRKVNISAVRAKGHIVSAQESSYKINIRKRKKVILERTRSFKEQQQCTRSHTPSKIQRAHMGRAGIGARSKQPVEVPQANVISTVYLLNKRER